MDERLHLKDIFIDCPPFVLNLTKDVKVIRH